MSKTIKVLILKGFKEDYDGTKLGFSLDRNNNIHAASFNWESAQSLYNYLLSKKYDDTYFNTSKNYDVIIVRPYVQLDGDAIPNYELAKLYKQKCLQQGFLCPRIILPLYQDVEKLPTWAKGFESYTEPKLSSRIKKIIIDSKRGKISNHFVFINPYADTKASPVSYGITQDTNTIVSTYEMVESVFYGDRAHSISTIHDVVVPTVRLMVSHGNGLTLMNPITKVLRSIRVFDLDGSNNEYYYSKSRHVNGWSAAKWEVKKMETDGYEMSEGHIRSEKTLDLLHLISGFALQQIQPATAEV